MNPQQVLSREKDYESLPSKKQRVSKGRYYRKNLITLLLIASIPGIIVGIVIYWLVVSQMEEEFSRLHQNQINNRAENIADQFAYMELGLSHWAFEPRFGEELKDMDYVYHFDQTEDIVTTLYVLQGSHPLIQQVQLYLNEPQPILFNRSYGELADEQLINSYNQYLTDGGQVYWTDRLPGKLLEEGSTTAEQLLHTDPSEALVLVHKIPGSSTAPFGALIVTLDNEKVRNLLKTLTPYDQGSTFLMDGSGEVLIAGGDHEGTPSGELNEQIRQQVDLQQDKGSFLYTFENTTYSVSYGKLNRIDSDWIYVSAAPITDITEPLLSVSKVIVIISTAGFVLAVILSWLASRRIYSPIERLLGVLGTNDSEKGALQGPLLHHDEFELLEAYWNDLLTERSRARRKLDDQLPMLRGSFLMQLVQGHLSSHSESDLKEQMSELGFKVEDRQFLLMKLQLTGYSNLTGRFSEQDTGLVTFAAVNIIEEFAAQRFDEAMVLNFHDLSAAVLITGTNGESLKSSALDWGDELMLVINRIMKMNVTILVGRLTESVSELPALFLELEQAEAFRSIEELNQLLDLDHEMLFRKIEEASYPFLLERDIVQAVRTGKAEEAERLLAQFMEEAVKQNTTEYQLQQTMLQLLASLLHMMLQSGVPSHQLFNGRNLYEEIASLKERCPIEKWMRKEVFLPYIRYMEERSHAGLKPIVDRTIQRIDEQYMTDISLESCADLEGMTPYALSKAFKQVAGINFIDYVTYKRIEAAKELLRETDLKMNDIADRVGYQHSYFNRIFKKQEGMTPGQYREQWHQ
ncbi:AraC family transcriptional regulator [Neobacillus mesonae]|nr:AraC family transcriptional regulator [Neobacillus mesonae]